MVFPPESIAISWYSEPDEPLLAMGLSDVVVANATSSMNFLEMFSKPATYFCNRNQIVKLTAPDKQYLRGNRCQIFTCLQQ